MKAKTAVKDLKQAIHEGRQRKKYRWILHQLRLRYFDYQDNGATAFARYRRVVEKVERRILRFCDIVKPSTLE